MPDAPRPTVADHLLDRLGAWDVRRIFGYPGDGVNGVMGALERAGDRFDFVQAAHEEFAGLMAVAHAKCTGETDPRLAVLVLNNRDLNYVTWGQRVMDGFPRYAASQAVPDFRYADYARLLGLDGVRVERPEDVGAAWDRALAADRPFVIDAVVDAAVPTVPPELKPEQEDKLAKALDGESRRDAAGVDAILRQLQLHEVTQRA